MKTLKVIGIVLLAILSAACVGVDGWYVYLRVSGKEKVVSNTFKVGLVELDDGISNYFAEVNLFRNSDNSGEKVFEIKYNVLLDESRQAFFSQGMQFTAHDNVISFPFDYSDENIVKQKDTGFMLGRKQVLNGQGKYVASAHYYNYSSSDDYSTTINSTFPLGDDSFFKITLDGKVYGMKFNRDIDYSSEFPFFRSYVGPVAGVQHFYYYPENNIFYFAKLIYEGCSSLKAGTNRSIVFNFGNMFDYYSYNNDTGVYDLITNESDTSLVKQLIQSYYCIKVNIYDNGLIKSSDSLFNCFKGNANYNASGNYSSDDYFIGRPIITADIYDFDLVKVVENNYCLKLKDGFINYYKQFRDGIYIDVVIDLDTLEKLNCNFLGFTENSGLDNFTIHKCVTHKLQDGQIIESEVSYD